ncbi:MAG: pyridoxamine 5'-phosphate oxidase family protein [Noviherbaspirillum sp.]
MDTASDAMLRTAPFHAGEISAQERTGVRAKMEKVGNAFLRNYMPEQHREFFALLPTLFAGGSDADGCLWASLLWGDAGFVQSPAPASLRVGAHLLPDDPLAAMLQPGAPLGLLGLEFETRRRNRANGVVAEVDAQGFTFTVQQSFGNCHKYIQTRERIASPSGEQAAAPLKGSGPLPDAALTLIRQSDTFFIATAVAHGADVSHRGGRPGFVQVDAQGVITWPDFQGNNFFNTIGNLLADGRAGLLFIDFERGDLLQLSGRAEVLWDGPEVERFQGAQRMLRFSTEHFILRQRALPLRWSLCEPSPHLEATGIWDR